MPNTSDSALGAYLRDRRTRLDPAALGYSGRRRTPGLRREEVASRANISPTWYTWLEQGRGGAPSADVLNRLARGLMLTEPEREHLFMLGLGRPPDANYRQVDGVTPRLQRVLDVLGSSPAIVKTALWDVIAWNAAASLVLTDYGALPPGRRNVLRMMFDSGYADSGHADGGSIAQFAVSAFRADVLRAGASAESSKLVEDLAKESAEFDRLWRSNDVVEQVPGLKRLQHAQLGSIELELSIFSVDGRPELAMVVFNPVSPDLAAAIDALLAQE